MDPASTAIGGSRKTDVGTATIKEAALLEGRNDRVAKGKGARLDFRGVITGGVVKGVATDLDETRRKGDGSYNESKYEGQYERREGEGHPLASSPSIARNDRHCNFSLFLTRVWLSGTVLSRA